MEDDTEKRLEDSMKCLEKTLDSINKNIGNEFEKDGMIFSIGYRRGELFNPDYITSILIDTNSPINKVVYFMNAEVYDVYSINDRGLLYSNLYNGIRQGIEKALARYRELNES